MRLASLGLAAPSPATIADASVLSRKAWHSPFAARAARPAFVAATPGGTTAISRLVHHSDGLAICDLLVEPRTPGRHPVLIFNHGGVGQWGRIVVPDIPEMSQLAERGYVVLASTFCGEDEPDMGGGDAADALALIDVAATPPGANTRRIGIWGFNHGGLTADDALAKSRRIAPAVVAGGPTDIVQAARGPAFDAPVYPDAVTEHLADREGVLVARAPPCWPDRRSPNAAILILHGRGDPRVEPTDAIRMATVLRTTLNADARRGEDCALTQFGLSR